MTSLDQTTKDLLGGLGLADLEEQANAVLKKDTTPWFLQPFIFLGALVAAVMFIIAFILLIDVFIDIDRWGVFCMGVVYVLGAVLLHRWRLNIYTDSLALAFSLGGHGFVMAAMGPPHRWSDPWMTAFLVFLGLCAILYFLYRDGLHRYLTVAWVVVLAKAAFSRDDLDLTLHGFVLLTAGIAAWTLTRNRERPELQPLAYGCCTGLVLLLLPVGQRHNDFLFTRHAMSQPWISSILMGIALLWILHWVSRKPVAPAAKTVAVLVTAGLAALSTPGILAALFLATLGHGSYHWRMTMLGLLSLPIFLWKYYYSLDVDFMTKSGVLAASGAGLLIARWVLGYLRNKT